MKQELQVFDGCTKMVHSLVQVHNFQAPVIVTFLYLFTQTSMKFANGRLQRVSAELLFFIAEVVKDNIAAHL
ncbi:hypothetical protein JHW43_004352 [Diplocarpon mali]|nr:hypothetical protein JHW43_004352 [Diplocarpon mali]